jgi:methylated-DNA-[protein]-cysteine S-methyltransferase
MASSNLSWDRQCSAFSYMTGQLKYVTFDTKMGWVGILGSPKGIMRTTLPQPSAEEARRLLGKQADCAEPSRRLFENLIARFRSYFLAEKVDFPDELDLSGATSFQRQVWETIRLIPYGDTRSYEWVGKQIGKPRAARAVGQALARNQLPIIIPCHRVVNSDGRLGGFSGGLEMKSRLLKLEAEVTSNCNNSPRRI